MSLTLGEKLQQAREARGITISEVAEQTRISGLYLEAIENNDYRTLPGGIFNKGFVKSYARYVGIDEQEALQDYTQLITEQQGAQAVDAPKTYKPEVLTDDRASSSSLLTIIFAVVILGLMTWGILALVSYLQSEQSPLTSSNSNANSNANTANAAVNSNANVSPPMPSTNEISIEIRTSEDVSATVVADNKTSYPTIKPDTPFNLKPQESFRISYSKSKGNAVKLTLNGKSVNVPAQPAPGQGTIRYDINKANIAQILQSGEVTNAAPPSAPR